MISIHELLIRLPGINEEQGNMLGNQVAEKIVSSLPPSTGDQYIPELKIQMEGALPKDALTIADQVANQIIRQIKLSTR